MPHGNMPSRLCVVEQAERPTLVGHRSGEASVSQQTHNTHKLKKLFLTFSRRGWVTVIFF